MSYSSTTLVGNLGQQPETRTLDNGSTVTRMWVATSRTWKDASGNKQEATEWHNVVLWNKLGQLAQQYLDKGSKVLIVGQIRYRTDDRNGDKRYYTDIVASEMKFLSSGKRNDSRFPAAEQAPVPAVAKQPTAAAGGNEDLPF